MCGICEKLGVQNRHVREGSERLDFNLDDYAGSGLTFRGKPIFDQAGVINQIDAGREIKASNGVITYTFLDLGHLTGLYNNPNFGFTAGIGLSPFTAEQRDQARDSVKLWDDLIPQTFKETKGLGADIQFSNSADPAQAYAYYPGKQGWKFQSDVFVADPELNWTNEWFSFGGYGRTTLVHELGHSLGLSHPGDYNGAGATTYADQAEYAQDSTQYSIMSYWSASETGARIVNWNEFLFSNAQTPLLHDILTIQSKYGADPTTRAGNTTYGFNSNAGNAVYDFSKNPYPYLSIYDAGGIDTLNLSGYTIGQFIDLHPGSFSSVGAGAPTEATVNAALAKLTEISGEDWGTIDQGTINAIINSFRTANAADIALDTGVSGIFASEYSNLSIAYNTTIENAIGGSARDLIWGNAVANRLEGRGGHDVLNGYEGADTLLGGAGNDTFEFSHLEKGDRIGDWNAGDKIDLTKLDAVAGGADNAFAFLGGGAFTKKAGELRYANGLLQGDTNGDGIADFAVAITGAPALTAADILL